MVSGRGRDCDGEDMVARGDDDGVGGSGDVQLDMRGRRGR